jgi:inositol oxygenase
MQWPFALPTYLPKFNSGDTFPVGCKHSNKIVFHKYFSDNPDGANPLYNTQCGIYKPGIGLDNVHLSWGHDEYMYQVCVQNGCTLPPEGLAIIRYHSFYALHRDGDYQYLMDDRDHEMLHWVRVFNQFDLYSKSSEVVEWDTVKGYYESLIRKYFPVDVLNW